MMLSIFKALLFFMFFCIGSAWFYFAPTRAVHALDERLNDIEFQDKDWSSNELWMLKHIPSFIDEDTDFAVAPPPLNDSEETQKELELLQLYARERRTPDQLRLIKLESGVVPKGLSKTEKTALQIKMRDLRTLVLDPEASDDPALYSQIDLLTGLLFIEASHFVMKEKKRFKRPRPSQLMPDFKTAIPVPAYPAYPSGHATQSRVLARFLGYIDPEHKVQYEQNANDIAIRREIAGLHYPSDTQAGIQMADEMFELLLQNEEFKTKADDFRKRVSD